MSKLNDFFSDPWPISGFCVILMTNRYLKHNLLDGGNYYKYLHGISRRSFSKNSQSTPTDLGHWGWASTFIHRDLQRLEHTAHQRMGQASHLCASVWEITAIWSRPAPEECCSCRYITSKEAAKLAPGIREAAWTWAGRAGKGSGSGLHQGFAKWSWVMSAVWGGEE